MDASGARAEGDALGVIAGGGTDHTALGGGRGELSDLVVGAANFERKHRLEVFTFEEDAIVQTARQPRCGVQRRFHGDVVHLGFEDAIYVVFLHGLHI